MGKQEVLCGRVGEPNNNIRAICSMAKTSGFDKWEDSLSPYTSHSSIFRRFEEVGGFAEKTDTKASPNVLCFGFFLMKLFKMVNCLRKS